MKNHVKALVNKGAEAGGILGFLKWGGTGGAKIQSGGAHGKSHVPQHKWDDMKRELHKCLDNSSLFL